MSMGDEIFYCSYDFKIQKKIFQSDCAFWSERHKAWIWHVSLCKVPLLCSPFFPAGMFLTLTSRVYQPLQDIKECRPNSLSSQVSSKINNALWEPVFPRGAPPHIYTHTKKMQPPRLVSSCLSAGMTSAPGPVTRTAGYPREKGHSGAFKRCRHLFYHVLSQSEKRDQWSTSPNRWQ